MQMLEVYYAEYICSVNTGRVTLAKMADQQQHAATSFSRSSSSFVLLYPSVAVLKDP